MTASTTPPATADSAMYSATQCASRRRRLPRRGAAALTVVAMLGAWSARADAQPAAAPAARPASAAASAATPSSGSSTPRATAPTNPTQRLIQDAQATNKEQPQNVAPAPQVAVPLGRTQSHKPIALKPGKPASPQGAVDDRAARCQAEKASDARAKCSAP